MFATVILAILSIAVATAQSRASVSDIKLAAGVHSQTDEAASALAIASGDLLDVQVFDTPELSAKLRVDARLRLLSKWCSGYGRQRPMRGGGEPLVTHRRPHVIEPRQLR